MDFNSRFSEYGLTGAFFCTLQIFVFFIFFDFQSAGLESFRALMDISFGSLGTLATIIGVIAIFFIGQALHTLTIILVPTEMPIFWKSMSKSQEVLQTLYDSEPESYYIKSLQKFYDEYEGSHTVSFSPRTILKRMRLFTPYLQAQDYLLAKVINSGLNDCSLLKQRLNNWQATRAFAVSLIFIFIEILFLTLDDNKKVHPAFADNLHYLIMASFILLAIAMWVSRAAFKAWSRLLFALTYISSQKN